MEPRRPLPHSPSRSPDLHEASRVAEEKEKESEWVLGCDALPRSLRRLLGSGRGSGDNSRRA